MDAESFKICRVCLEPSDKMYPLVGNIANVDVNLATMISYCILDELQLDEYLPDSVCVSCFKIIRIAYNFIRQFKDSQERLLETKRKIQENLTNLDFGENETIEEEDTSCTEANHITYNLETIHNYVQKVPALEHVDSSSNLTHSVNENTSEENPLIKMGFIDPNVLNDDLPESSDKGSVNFYTCPICKSGFVHIQQFNRHILSHKINVIVCKKCTTPVELNVSEYVEHYKEYHRYQCDLCNKNFTSTYGFQYHMKRHENDKKYVCSAKGCTRSYFLYHLLKKHMVSHTKEANHKCDLCSVNFRHYDTLRYHKRRYHVGERNHLCTLCGKAFFQAVHLRDHMFRHTGHKQFSCDACGLAFVTNSQLKKHFKHCHYLSRK